MGWGEEATWGHRRKHQVCSGGRRSKEKAWPRAFPAGKARQVGLVCLTNVSSLWAKGMVLGFSGTWPWVGLGQGKYLGLGV